MKRLIISAIAAINISLFLITAVNAQKYEVSSGDTLKVYNKKMEDQRRLDSLKNASKDAEQTEKSAREAAKETKKAVNAEKKAQKARENADEQNRKANKATEKSDSNF